jgi:hypothetical protein
VKGVEVWKEGDKRDYYRARGAKREGAGDLCERVRQREKEKEREREQESE